MQIYPRLLGEFYTCMMKIWLFETLCAMNGPFDKDATPPSTKETQDPANKGWDSDKWLWIFTSDLAKC